MKSNTLRTWKKVFSKGLAAAVIALAVVLIPTFTVQAASAPSLNKTSKNILIKGTYDLNVENAVKGSTYAWTSSDTKVATVDEAGVVKGKIKGSTVITCKVTTPADKVYTLTCKVSVKKGAEAFEIGNKATALNVGQVFNAEGKLTPATSDDVISWSSSNKAVATVDKSGKVTALKKGTVTITATTLSGKSDKMTMKVVGSTGAVASQKQLEALLGTGVQTITLSTSSEVTFDVPEGSYKDTKLVVDAPFADVNNHGLFSSIEILQVAANTYHEFASGNDIVISAGNSHVIIEQGASVLGITITEKGAVVKVENNGVVREIILEDAADLEISGETTTPIPVVVEKAGATITSSAPIAVTASAPATLTLLPGAEKSTISADKKENVPTINGDVKIPVTVGEGETKTVQTVEGKKLEGGTANTPAAGFPGTTGGSTGTTTSPVYSINKLFYTDGSVGYLLSHSYTELKSIVVKYKGVSYTIDSDLLVKLKQFISNDTSYLTLWNSIVDETRTFGGQQVKITGVAGSGTKKVTFVGGLLGGKAYTVSAASVNSVTVTNGAGLSFTLTRVEDTLLRINTSVSDLTFDPAF